MLVIYKDKQTRLSSRVLPLRQKVRNMPTSHAMLGIGLLIQGASKRLACFGEDTNVYVGLFM